MTFPCWWHFSFGDILVLVTFQVWWYFSFGDISVLRTFKFWGLSVITLYTFYVHFFRVLMTLWETAFLPWDLLCFPGRIAWEGDNTQHTTHNPQTDIATTRPNRPSGPIRLKIFWIQFSNQNQSAKEHHVEKISKKKSVLEICRNTEAKFSYLNRPGWKQGLLYKHFYQYFIRQLIFYSFPTILRCYAQWGKDRFSSYKIGYVTYS